MLAKSSKKSIASCQPKIKLSSRRILSLIDRGLMASIYVTLNYSITADKVHSLYQNVYADEPLVNVLPPGQQATFKAVQRKNTAEISITPVGEHYVHITCTLDNLRKGAASQAVQCFNLMYGFSETEGLL